MNRSLLRSEIGALVPPMHVDVEVEVACTSFEWRGSFGGDTASLCAAAAVGGGGASDPVMGAAYGFTVVTDLSALKTGTGALLLGRGATATARWSL
mmetsp:Transcript_63505/g.124703  ORF Transcript_63505/g.124703 Transcript_63505/m.124703 type:complete len:96 (+) Transcript_63505:130-417(+)